MSRNWNELVAWQESHNFILDIYKLTSKLPKEEVYG
ncbi:four helix bundle protein, partial [Deferribacter desulfuricans]